MAHARASGRSTSLRRRAGRKRPGNVRACYAPMRAIGTDRIRARQACTSLAASSKPATRPDTTVLRVWRWPGIRVTSNRWREGRPAPATIVGAGNQSRDRGLCAPGAHDPARRDRARWPRTGTLTGSVELLYNSTPHQARSSAGQSTTLTWWGSLVRVQSRLPGILGKQWASPGNPGLAFFDASACSRLRCGAAGGDRTHAAAFDQVARGRGHH